MFRNLLNGRMVTFNPEDAKITEEAVIDNHVDLPIQPRHGSINGKITSSTESGIPILDVLVRHEDTYTSYRVKAQYTVDIDS